MIISIKKERALMTTDPSQEVNELRQELAAAAGIDNTDTLPPGMSEEKAKAEIQRMIDIFYGEPPTEP